ncbi:protein phosphatase 2C [Pycnococcus provasolii]
MAPSWMSMSPATPAQSNPQTSPAHPPLASLASKLGVLVLASRDLASRSAVASNPVALSVTTVSMGLLGIRALIARRNLGGGGGGGGGRSGSARKHKGENFDTPGSALRVYKDGTAVPLETNDTTQKTQKAASTQKKSSNLATRLQNDNLKKRSVVVVDLPPLLVLKATAGPSAGKTYEADPYAGALVIGRGGPCEFALTNDPEVSTSHAEIDWNEEDRVWRIRDVGSLNGTKLNGAPLVSRGSEGGSPFFTILEGDVIELGTKTQVLVNLTSHEAQSSVPRHAKHASTTTRDITTSEPTPGNHAIPSSAIPKPIGIDASPVGKSEMVVNRFGICYHAASLVGAQGAQNMPNEDALVADVPLRTHPTLALFAAIDGHCGPAAAARIQDLLPRAVASAVTRNAGVEGRLSAEALADGMGAVVLTEALEKLDADLCASPDCEHCGAVACVVLLWRTMPYNTDARSSLERTSSVGNDQAINTPRRGVRFGDPATLQGICATVGDSRAVLLQDQLKGPGSHRNGVDATFLTGLHRLNVPSERKRIAKLRGETRMRGGEQRIFGLSVSRALGDAFVKRADKGFTGTPELSSVFSMGPSDAIIMATDGLWDFCTEGQACRAWMNARNANAPKRWDDVSSSSKAAASDAANSLIALKKSRRDDASVLVIAPLKFT